MSGHNSEFVKIALALIGALVILLWLVQKL